MGHEDEIRADDDLFHTSHEADGVSEAAGEDERLTK
jgi:hypothetical protein